MADVRHNNVELITAFDDSLSKYESSLPVNGSNILADYRMSAKILKAALERMIVSHHQDTLSMMRILTERITKNIGTSFSDMTLSMVAASTAPDETRSRDLIYAIPYVICEMINGEYINLDDRWLAKVEQNNAIRAFLENYNQSDQSITNETYSGNVISPDASVSYVESTSDSCTLMIGYSKYELALVNKTAQSVKFAVSPDVKPGEDADKTKKLTIDTTVVITPSAGYLTIDQSIGFFDDAASQIAALRCCVQGVVDGCDTVIQLPAPLYRLALSVVSYDSGASWRIAEVNILPPKSNVTVLAKS